MRLLLAIVIAGLVLIAAGLPLVFRQGGETYPPLQSNGERSERWFSERSERFASYEYVDLTDHARIEALVRSWLAARTSRLPADDEQALARDISGFLKPLTAFSAEEYLRLVAPHRALRADVDSDRHLQARYRELTGRTMSLSESADDLLKRFLRGHPQSPDRPMAVSALGVLDTAATRPLIAGGTAAEDVVGATRPRFFSAVTGTEFGATWQSPTVQAFIRVTDPSQSLATTVQQHGTTMGCLFYCVVRTTAQQHVILSAYLYHVPEQQHWHVQVASHQHTMPLFWPL